MEDWDNLKVYSDEFDFGRWSMLNNIPQSFEIATLDIKPIERIETGDLELMPITQ